MDRSDSIRALRPIIEADCDTYSDVESFQNAVLRPILKFQHSLICSFLGQEDKLLQLIDAENSLSTKIVRTKHYLSKQPALRSTLVGLVIGLLSVDEMAFYLSNKRELDRRLSAMLAQRFVDEQMR